MAKLAARPRYKYRLSDTKPVILFNWIITFPLMLLCLVTVGIGEWLTGHFRRRRV